MAQKGRKASTLLSSRADIPTQIVQSQAGQTADMTQWVDSQGNVLARVDAEGSIGGFVSAKRWMKWDGTDETDAFKEAVAYARQNDVTLWLPDGETIVSAKLTGTDASDQVNPLRMRGMGPNTIIHHAIPNAQLIAQVGATPSTTTTFSSSAAVGDTTITVADASSLAAGDYVILLDTSASDLGEDDTGSARNTVVNHPGEWAQIKSISGSVLSLYGKLRDAYTTSAVVKKVTPIVGSDLRDFTVVWDLTALGNGFARAIQLNYCVDAVVSNVRFEDAVSTQISITASFNTRVEDCTFIHARDTESKIAAGWPTDNDPYCVAPGEMAQGVLIKGCRSRYGRHMVTCSGSVNNFASSQIVVADCIARDHSAACFDTHPGARWVTFDNCHAFNSQDSGFQIRGPDTHLIDCVVNGCAKGMYVVDGSTRCQIMGGHISECGTGVEIRDSNKVTIGGGLRIDDCTTYGIRTAATRAPWIGEMTDLDIDDVTISNNPTTAMSFGHWWYNGFRIGDGVRIPDATTKISGQTAPTLGAASTLTIPV